MKHYVILFVIGSLVLLGLLFLGSGIKAFFESQSSNTGKVPCTVFSTREDQAMDLHSHLSDLSKPDFLKKFAEQSRQPMAVVEFPLLGTPKNVPMGRSPIQILRAMIDSSWAKFTFPFSYQVNGQTYSASQVVSPVPIWLDPLPNFPKDSTNAVYDPAHPDKATCPEVIQWQAKLLTMAGLMFVGVPGMFLFFYKESQSVEKGDADIDRIYNERFKHNQFRR